MCQADESNLPPSLRAYNPFASPCPRAVEKIAAAAAILASSVLIGWLAVNRDYFTFATETDFLGGYMAEARRVLRGEPLRLPYHPPLYPIVLAHVWRGTHDWFRAGLLVSWLAAAVSLASAFVALRTLYGRAAAWGSLVGSVTSSLFVTYAASATVDVFFLALFYLAILASVRAARTPSTRRWCAAGLVLGVSLLTRSNAVSLLTLFAFPLLQERPWRHRLVSLGCMTLCCLLPLAVWGAYASSTGSPFLPSRGGLADNLAMTYFAERRAGVGGEALSQVKGRFERMSDVLTARPHVVASRYLRDLGLAVVRAFQANLLLAVPLNLLAFSGLILLVCTRLTTPALAFLASLLGQLALVNFKTYEARFYLFLVPVLGAAAGTMVTHLYRVIPGGRVRLSAVLIGALCLLGGAALTVQTAQAKLHAQDAELSAAVQAVRSVLTPETLVVARKRAHIAYYTGSHTLDFPQSADLEGLRDTLARYRASGQVLLYFGSNERHFRPHLIGLASPATAPKWLACVARGSEAGGWVLYRVLRPADAREGAPRCSPDQEEHHGARHGEDQPDDQPRP